MFDGDLCDSLHRLDIFIIIYVIPNIPYNEFTSGDTNYHDIGTCRSSIFGEFPHNDDTSDKQVDKGANRRLAW